METDIIYECHWSKDVHEEFIEDFCYVCSTVFNYNFSEEQFHKKFIENIYGPSVLVVVYIGDKPSAARALWRNDIANKESYQPGDTCVMSACRGKGVFTEMTKRAMALLPTDAVIYNFPNPNSFPGYIKMGWTLLHDYRVKLFTSYSDYVKEHPIKMDSKYANWWAVGKNLTYIKKWRHYFLLQKDHRPFCYHVLAEVDECIAKKFVRTQFGLLFYRSEQTTWYNKQFAQSHVVTRNPELGYIPVWKIDAI